MSPKKILIFSTAYLPLIGGAEISVKEITDRLGDEIEFDLITARIRRNFPKIERVGKVTVYRIGIGFELLDKLLVPFLGAVKAIQLNRVRNYSCFWCIMASFASGAAYIANWFQKKVPIVLTLQEGDSEQWLRYRWFGLLDLSWRMALKRTAHLTGLSNYLLERGRRLGYRGPMTLVPNGVDVGKFSASNSQFSKNSNETILITTSRLVEKNSVGDVIEALKFLPENMKLRIIGTGVLEKNLKAKTKNLKLDNRIEFLGPIDNQKLPPYLHNANIFVRPSLSEGQGISFIEAMAAEVPVVATPVGGIVDFLKDRETGLFCEVNNPKSIAEKVMEYINNPELTEKIIRNAKEMVVQQYDWDLIAKEMKAKVFDKV